MEPIVSIRNLVNAFGTHIVHDQLCLNIVPGEILGIVGGSGTGKSVLMRSMLGLRKPRAGEIRVLGRDVYSTGHGLRQRWGVLFQNGALISALTVRQNVELPIALHSDMPAATRRELAQLKIRMTGLALSALDKYPSELSGGMIKRAALARALALEPENTEGLLERGILRRLAGDETGARGDWLRVLALDPESPTAEAARANLEKLDVAVE